MFLVSLCNFVEFVLLSFNRRRRDDINFIYCSYLSKSCWINCLSNVFESSLKECIY